MSAWWWLNDLDPGQGGGDTPPAEDPQYPGPNAGPPEPEPSPDPVEVVHIYEWRASGDACPTCAALDGNRYEGEDGPWPPLHVNCRCRRVLVASEERRARDPWGWAGPVNFWG